MFADKKGYALPFTLLIIAGCLTCANLILAYAQARLKRQQAEARTLRMETLIPGYGRALQSHLATILDQASGASGLKQVDELPDKTVSAVWVTREQTDPLHSTSMDAQSMVFNATDQNSRLLADWIPLSETSGPEGYSVAWAFEDVGLTADATPPAFWPFQKLRILAQAPIDSTAPLEPNHALSSDYWIPTNEPIPFRPSAAPALTPVLEAVNLRFSIFASGPLRSREKVIRFRYIIEGRLWNPYNRELRFHDGGGQRPTFRISLKNLPRVRIHNISRGLRSAWIDLSEAKNENSHVRGVWAYVDLPPLMQAGERLSWSAPRPERQKEGLARTLHGGFLLGPADQIRLEFETEQNVAAVANQLEDDGADPAAGWAILSGSLPDLPDLQFNRADTGERPFFLSEGSLSFSRDKAYANLQLESPLHPHLPDSDPRYQTTAAQRPHLDQVTFNDLRETPDQTRNSVDPSILFSWPANEPDSLLSQTDLPSPENGFQLGWPGTAINELLEQPDSVWPVRDSESLRPPPTLSINAYRDCLPVNTIRETAWLECFSDAEAVADEIRRFPAFAHVDHDNPNDFAEFTSKSLTKAATELASSARHKPHAGVAHFFNSGSSLDALNIRKEATPKYLNLPLKGLFGNGPALSRHSSAWVLHLAIRFQNEELSLLRTARFWFLQTRLLETGASEMLLVHEEATPPHMHLQPASQSLTDRTGPAQETSPPPP